MIWSESTTEMALGFGIALAVGTLVGIERERHATVEETPTFAGIRTFPMIALVGAIAGLLSVAWGPLVLLPPFLVLGLLVCFNYWWERKREEVPDPGLTTEMSALAVFGLGALPFIQELGLDFFERLILTGALGAIIMALLSLKAPLHKAAARVSKEDLYATVRFLLLAVVILPLLPDHNFGRFEALNPFWIGVVVVLVAGISFTGYFAVKFLGARKGIGFTAFFGGLASSTAVALSFSERGRKHPQLALMCAFAIILASTVMFPRIWIELAAINPRIVAPTLVPIGGMLAVGLTGCAVIYWRSARAKEKQEEEPEFSNPFQLGQALKLGLLFAAVRLVSAAAHDFFGDTGLYVSALLAGLTDVDAITISVAQMHKAGDKIGTGTAVFAITLAAISNTLTKGGIALVLGGQKVGLIVLAVLVPAGVTGLVLALLAL